MTGLVSTLSNTLKNNLMTRYDYTGDDKPRMILVAGPALLSRLLILGTCFP